MWEGGIPSQDLKQNLPSAGYHAMKAYVNRVKNVQGRKAVIYKPTCGL